MLKNIEYYVLNERIEIDINCETMEEMARFRSTIETYAKEELLYLEFKSYNDKDYQSKNFDVIVIEDGNEFLSEIKKDLKEVINLALEEMEIVGYWD